MSCGRELEFGMVRSLPEILSYGCTGGKLCYERWFVITISPHDSSKDSSVSVHASTFVFADPTGPSGGLGWAYVGCSTENIET